MPADFRDNMNLVKEQGLEGVNYPREIKRSNLLLLDILGEGEFGVVHKALLNESSTGGVGESGH